MSLSVSKIINVHPAALKFLEPDENKDAPPHVFETRGGVLPGIDYGWLSNGPYLEVINTKTGFKVGGWTFGYVLRDTNTKVVCVDVIQRPNQKSFPLLAIAVDCDLGGGMICIFDFIISKIIRAIQIEDNITFLHVIDQGYDVLLPSALRNFDGVIAAGTIGGEVFLIDICRQICDEALTPTGLNDIRDELNPCQLHITLKDIEKMEFHKEFAVRNSHHLAIHLNYVSDNLKHFSLKGPNDDDRIYVNKAEVTVSALYYCPQLGSLLVGYNFGAFQLYNLTNLKLVYTSPICDEHIPISHFAIQEPADDPRPVCYIWAVYCVSGRRPTCLPLAVMYAFSYRTKEYHEGYEIIYHDFNSASILYQMELPVPEGHRRFLKQRGGTCLKVTSIHIGSVNKEGPHHESTEDSLTLCVFIWNVWFSNNEKDTFLAIFDLNQWYKEQMPNVPNSHYFSTYMIQMCLNGLINNVTNKNELILDVHIDKNSIRQFIGPQRLEEHFYPNSLSFSMTCLLETDIICLRNLGVQKALLAQIELSGPLCLIEPADIYQEIIGLGLVPLFIDLPVNTPVTTNQQREIILSTAVENQLIGWLCKCASEWANGSFLSAGCSLDWLISWAFQRAITLKNNCDKFCVPLFDYSQIRMDNNTKILLNNSMRQLNTLRSLYAFITGELSRYVTNSELVKEQFSSLYNVCVFFDVLQWCVNVGLLPECPFTAYPQRDELERISVPYPAEQLTEIYNHRRGLLKILNEEQFSSSESILFIDNLIERDCGGKTLQEQWRNDGGSGLYPPPSLQSLLRTYLIDNADLSYKHVVITYVFLDLAATLDQERYKPVVKYLFNFPAIFGVPLSVRKITQAFWQLDHSDYNTAMDLFLDPLFSTRDLHDWHHKIVLRALILQKQHSFALKYVQVRKPNLADDEYILSVISLYVANNMINEAFNFEKNYRNLAKGNKFLLHIFDECKKNDKLKLLIYRTFSSTDEEIFLKYLTDLKESSANDIEVYYHAVRSHFIEAFESHDRTSSNQVENQGLFCQKNASLGDVSNHMENQGLFDEKNALVRDNVLNHIDFQELFSQKNASSGDDVSNLRDIIRYFFPQKNSGTFRDEFIKSLKTMLPDIHRDLINYCRKEKTNSRQKVSSPIPMSLSVHNSKKNVRYKSTLIGTALTQARHVLNGTLRNNAKLETEGTPFLRTSVISVGPRSSSKVIITPRIIQTVDDDNKEIGTPPASKRLKLSPRVSTSASTSFPTKLETPLVKRKTPKARNTKDHFKVETPHSILKVKNVSNRTSGIQFEDDFKKFEKLEYTPVSSAPKKTGLGLSARKSIGKPSPTVRFEGLTNSSSSLSSSENFSKTLQESPTRLSTSPTVNVSEVKNSSTEEDTFYSPQTSFENEETQKSTESPKLDLEETFAPTGRRNSELSKLDLEDHALTEEKETSEILSPRGSRMTKVTKLDLEENEVTEEKQTSVVFSPKSRRSYRRTLEQVTPVRSSPRLSRNASFETPKSKKESTVVNSEKIESFVDISKKEESDVDDSIKEPEKSQYESSSPILPKLRPRKSLCRKVLETNALNRIINSPVTSPRKFNSTSTLEVTTVEESTEKVVLESTLKYKDGEETHKTTFVNKHNSTESFMDTDVDTSGEYSFSYGTSELPFSDMLRDMDSPNKSFLKNNSDKDLSEKSEIDVNVTQVVEKEEKAIEQQTMFEKSGMKTSEQHEVQNEVSDVREGDDEEFILTISEESSPKISEKIEVQNEKSDVGEVDDKELTQTIDEEPILNISEEDKVQNDEIEPMDVSDVEISEDNKTEKIEEPLYETLKNSSFGQTTEYTEDLNKDENVSCFEGEGYRPLDAQMNVFEVSDDLRYNDGWDIGNEVTLEEKDLCYEQQNTLENVWEENINPMSTSPLEKNILNENLSLENDEESNNEEIDEKSSSQCTNKEEDDIIEISSSSNEEKSKDNSGSSQSYHSTPLRHSSESCEESLEVTYGGQIYDTVYDSSDSYERHHSEISENSDDEMIEVTKKDFGIFEGSIIYQGAEEKKNEEVEEQSEDEESEEELSEEEEDLSEEESRQGKEQHVKEELRTKTVEENKNEEVENQREIETENEQSVKEEDLNEQEIKQSNEELKERYEDGRKKEKDLNKQEHEKQTDEEQNEDENVQQYGKEKRSEKGNEYEESLRQKEVQIEENRGYVPGAIEALNYSEQKKTDCQIVGQIEKTTKEQRNNFITTQACGNIENQNVEEKSDQNTNEKKQRDSRTTRSKCQKTETEEQNEILVETPIVRKLRSRTVSTEEIQKPAKTLRKRSASVDEAAQAAEKQKEPKIGIKKGRNRRVASETHLPRIEEENNVKTKKSKSMLEGYSEARRLTRRQMNLLKTISETSESSKTDLEIMDPIVLLDKVSFEGMTDPEEKKVYETSPSTSASSWSEKPSRNLRSASQASLRSRSKTPVRSTKGRGRKKSTDEVPTQSTENDKTEENIKFEPRTTRSRTKSISSVNSDDSHISNTVKPGNRKQRRVSQTKLSEIMEESEKSESVVSKRRTRRSTSGSQI